jgi:hypothetical protein
MRSKVRVLQRYLNNQLFKFRCRFVGNLPSEGIAGKLIGEVWERHDIDAVLCTQYRSRTSTIWAGFEQAPQPESPLGLVPTQKHLHQNGIDNLISNDYRRILIS